MLRFQLAKLLHQSIVFAIGDLRTLLQIVEVIVTPYLVTELLDLLFNRSCRQGASGRIKKVSRSAIVALKCATDQTIIEGIEKFFAHAQYFTLRGGRI